MNSAVFALGLFVFAANPVLASDQGSFDRTLRVTGEVELEVVSNPGGGADAALAQEVLLVTGGGAYE